MRHLIVNADDFGHTAGVNRGIAEAHLHGIVTSTSLMVNEPGAADAARIAHGMPALSVGLHVCVTDELANPMMPLADAAALRAEIERQIARFEQLLGTPPAHLDSHHNVHLRPEALPAFQEVAREHRMLMRDDPPVRYFPGFYGQWDGETHLEHIAPDSLMQMLDAEVGEGITEFGCHPGYVDDGLQSTYAIERETEVRTLCDPAVRAHVEAAGIALINSIEARSLALAGSAR